MTLPEPRNDLKKLLALLAISTGGGLQLGARLRRSEAAQSDAQKKTSPPPESTDDRISVFLSRLEDLERRIERPEQTQAEIDARIEQVEIRLRRDLEIRSTESMEALRESMFARLDRRIEPLESEIAAQRASLRDLSDYSLRTEQSLQKLLEGIDRLVEARSPRIQVNKT